MGGVKKVSLSSSATSFTDWRLAEGARGELLREVPSVHPLCWEFLFQLHKKHATLQQVQESATEKDTSGKSPEELLRALVQNKATKAPFSLSAWNKKFSHDVDDSRDVGERLMRLNDAVMMYDEYDEDLSNNNKAATSTLSSGGAKEDGVQLSDTDRAEMKAMCSEEIDGLIIELRDRADDVKALIHRRVAASDVLGSSSRTWTVELSGKAGGTEASLFAAELLEVIKNYATSVHGWRCEPILQDDATTGTTVASGTKLQIIGDDVYRFLRHEIGVHKVQRVPVTDHDGKMQTSTAVFTMVPVLDPVAVEVRESDCNIEFVRGSGPGGQGMQSSSNCCVLLHRPSGITVKCHQSRSALGNKELALQTVSQQILAKKVREQEGSYNAAWMNQWTSGERSEKMRTYNYPQNRVTDHRVGRDFPLVSFMEGGALWKELHDVLSEADDRSMMESMLRKCLEGDLGSDV